MTDLYHDAAFAAPKVSVKKDLDEVVFFFGDDAVVISKVTDPASFLARVKKEIERALGEISS